MQRKNSCWGYKMRINSEGTKISNIRKMLNTLFVDCNVRSSTDLEKKVQQPVITAARNMKYIKLETNFNGGFQYRITPKGMNYRDNKL